MLKNFWEKMKIWLSKYFEDENREYFENYDFDPDDWEDEWWH